MSLLADVTVFLSDVILVIVVTSRDLQIKQVRKMVFLNMGILCFAEN